MSHPFLPTLRRPLVLASQSPRRAGLLQAHGLEFSIAPAGIPEELLPDETPVGHVERLAAAKAQAVARTRPEALCIGCDTVVVIEDEILGKPADEAEARAMLRRLSGADHEVFSGVALAVEERGHIEAAHQRTRVRFRELDDAEIAAYVATGEPLDKAGAYGIQSFGSMLVQEIDGCYFNVMGLPLQALRRLWLRWVRLDSPRSAEEDSRT